MHYQKITTLKRALKAPMFEKLTDRETTIYRTGFRFAYKIAKEAFKLKRQNNFLFRKTSSRRLPKLEELYKTIITVCDHYKVAKKDVIGKNRRAAVCRVRSILINLFFETYDINLSEIGRYFGMDHTSILHHTNLKKHNQRWWCEGSAIWKDFEELQKIISS